MKHPICPDHMAGDKSVNPSAVRRDFDDKGQRYDRPDYRLSKEKKKMIFSFCDVCNIQLNSAAQAQLHYHGKSHLKRVKQLNNGKIPTNTSNLFASSSTGSTCHSTSLPTLVRTPTLVMQPSLDVKSFVSFPVESSSAVGLFPNFNTMDPVQKAVINHTFGVSLPLKKKQVISCNVCQLRFNSDSQAEAHYKGSKHAKKVKALEATKTRPKASASKNSAMANLNGSATPAPANISNKSDRAILKANDSSQLSRAEAVTFISASASAAAAVAAATVTTPLWPVSSKSTNGTTIAISESEEEKAKKLLYCSLCKVAVNSLSQLEAHNTGSKHKTMVEARNGAGPIKSYPRPGSRLKTHGTSTGSGLQNKTFHCEICDVHVNSEIQLKQHISSRRHKDRVAGKPTKPKYSPYNKLQRNPNILAAKLAFQKDILKPLAPAFLSSPLAAAAAAVSTALTLPPRPSAALFQAPAIPTALLRAGHGPLRTTPASILFAPY